MDKEKRKEQLEREEVDVFWNGIKDINLIQLQLEIMHRKLRDIKNSIYNKIPFDQNNKDPKDLKVWNPNNIKIYPDNTTIKSLRDMENSYETKKM